MQAGSAFALASCLGAAAFGQQPPSATEAIPRPSSLPAAVLAAPFSAERHQVRTHTLEDGTLITETWPVQRIFRDSAGRTRTDRALLTIPNAPEFPRIVELVDSTAGTEIILEPQRKLAHRFTGLAAATPAPPSADAENIGAWVIQGLRAEGQRTMSASDDGIIVTETWTAPDLHFVVRKKLFDPVLGESVAELAHIHTGEQEANLFQIPPDFKVVDEPDGFGIPYTVHSHISLPTLLSKVPAAYTEQARRGGVQGIVHLTLFVDETGRAQGIRVEHSLEPGLDQEAIKAVRRWRFHPGEQDGHAVRVPVKVDVVFSLN